MFCLICLLKIGFTTQSTPQQGKNLFELSMLASWFEIWLLKMTEKKNQKIEKPKLDLVKLVGALVSANGA